MIYICPIYSIYESSFLLSPLITCNYYSQYVVVVVVWYLLDGDHLSFLLFFITSSLVVVVLIPKDTGNIYKVLKKEENENSQN